MQFQDFDIDGFLRDYWQRKPLLIRNPWEEWRNPLEPDELASLACEEGIEARLIEQAGVEVQDPWNVEHGPLPEERFARLDKRQWTLLVQAVDHHVPQVASLLAPFRFIPNWRIDDVMVSYASDGGGVGPHFDHYDVFLIQGSGRRRWQVGAMCDAATPLLPHDDLRLLANFEPLEEWVLEPGDILYVPPGIAHNGVAVGDDCMTYSIGFRAPSTSEIIANYCDVVLGDLEDDDRFEDPGLELQDNPGEISGTAIARLNAMITQRLGDTDGFARWFGQYSTATKYPDIDWQPEEPVTCQAVEAGIGDGWRMCRNAASRFSYVQQGEGAVMLFVDGHCFDCEGAVAALAKKVCSKDRFALDSDMTLPPEALELLTRLFNLGSLAFDPSQ